MVSSSIKDMHLKKDFENFQKEVIRDLSPYEIGKDPVERHTASHRRIFNNDVIVGAKAI